ncbi:MAG: primosomal protein N', partial [Bacteroidia bacterium]|nr:primosomal protein N' [Bacteroidia bacterium]
SIDLNEDLFNALYVEVVLPLPLPKLFTYRLPSEFFELAMPGKRVFVPFGSRKVYTGIIVNVTTQKPERYEALNIISFIDDVPLVSDKQLKFWKWIAEYYMCSLGEVMAAALPSGLKLASETYIALQDHLEYDESVLDAREVLILKSLEGKEKVRISDLETLLKSKTSFVKVIKSLYDRDFIVMFEDVSDKYKPKLVAHISINPELQDDFIESSLNTLEKKANAQFKVLLALLGEPKQSAVKSELIKKYDLKSAAIKALIDKNIIIQKEVVTDRFAQKSILAPDFELSEPQTRALSEINTCFESKNVVLLHGATASGKTLLYVEKIKEYIALGQSVLYLVPELALTEQLITRLELYFADVMMVAHSRFSQNEKVEIWNKSANGEVKLLIGPRSAVFIPLQNLGLVIVDEEHEPAFKQHEKAPRYHARDTAIVLAHTEGAKVLLGSATPSIESYYNAKVGKYGLVELPELYGKAEKAKVIFGDIKEETRTKTMTGMFTSTLMEGLHRLKEIKGQAIVFQNRKGYVPMLECSECGWVSKCVNCDIALTYYKYSNNLRCHYCGYSQGNITKCQACGNNSMTIQGFGTERITEELQLLLPDARIIRFDQDSTRQKNAYRKLINDFENGNADIMVGTQIAVKGLDFKNVVLCAVVNADHLLNIPDFRSHERTFQLLFQLAGRAARHGREGVMVIQTRQIDHPVLIAVANYDFKGFYYAQIEERSQFAYAPFSKMIKLTLKHKSQDTIQHAAAFYSQLLRKQLGARVLGPETPFISKIKNQYLKNILIKLNVDKDNPKQIKEFLFKTFDFTMQNDQFKGLQLVTDVDNY